jgi:hypothetical protein
VSTAKYGSSELVEARRNPNWLLDFKYDVYSQTGEDGIIAKILDILPQRDEWCVEFGAWDGKYLSVTCKLITEKGYSGVLIEGDKTKYKALLKNYSENPKVRTLNKYVGFAERNCLDHLLQDTPIPVDFDFLGIDIDGNDYHVWKAMSKYSPKLVCIEFNPTIPNEVNFIQPADPEINQGCSLSALVQLGKEKGYELVSVLPFNAFFVKAEYYSLFKIEDNRPEVLRTDLSVVTHLFIGYDGTLFLSGGKVLPWHSLPLQESKIQHLPKFLRKHAARYTRLEGAIFLLLNDPKRLLKNAIGRVRRIGRRRQPACN